MAKTPTSPEIELLLAAYNDAKAAVERTPEYAVRQTAGVALSAAIAKQNAENIAARQAAWLKTPMIVVEPAVTKEKHGTTN